MQTRDSDFLVAVREVFQEAADKMLANPDIVLQIEQLWLRAIWKERERLFHYMGRQEIGEVFEDKRKMFEQLRWIVGNGTYCTPEPDLSVLPPFLDLQNREAVLHPFGVGFWKVLIGEQVFAHVEHIESKYWVLLFDVAGVAQHSDSFNSFSEAQEFLQTAFQSLTQGLHIRGYIRPDPADENRLYVEDAQNATWGVILKEEGSYTVTLYGDQEEVEVFDSPEAAERWMWQKISRMQKTSAEGTKVA